MLKVDRACLTDNDDDAFSRICIARRGIMEEG